MSFALDTNKWCEICTEICALWSAHQKAFELAFWVILLAFISEAYAELAQFTGTFSSSAQEAAQCKHLIQSVDVNISVYSCRPSLVSLCVGS